MLTFARLLRSRARNVALRSASRATGMVGLVSGDELPADTIVRFDIAAGEDPGRLLEDAMASTRARAMWFYGGDEVARRAVSTLGLTVEPFGAVFAHRMDALAQPLKVTLRAPNVRDRMTLAELQAEFAPGFVKPHVLFAMLGKDVIGVALSEALDPEWTEIRVVVYPSHRGRGFGTAIFAVLAHRLEGTGMLVCAAINTVDGRGRRALEHAGFRLTDYYFLARSRAR